MRRVRTPPTVPRRISTSEAILPVDLSSRFWSEIANNTTYTNVRRRWAVLQLFDIYLKPQATFKELGALLASPTWLRQDQIEYIDVPKGGTGLQPQFPIDLDRGDSLIGIRIFPPMTDDSMIYLRFAGRPRIEQIYTALMGEGSAADSIQIKEIAPSFVGVESIGGMHWRGGMKSPYEELIDLRKASGGGN